MYFSDREKKILTLLLEYQEGMTQSELQTQLGVSKRTVYREIASIEKAIKAYDIKVIKPRGSGYRLIGERENFRKLKEAVEAPEEEIFTNLQRQSGIVSYLLVAEAETTIESLSIDFQVSLNTIIADLAAVEEGLSDYHLKLLRLKARGILIEGDEKGRRQILSNLVYRETNEYEFFQYLESLREADAPLAPKNFFMKLVDDKAWYLALKVILEDAGNVFAEVTDNQLQLLLIELALSISRMSKGKMLTEIEADDVNRKSVKLARLLLSFLPNEGIDISEAEVVFLAQQLEGLNYKVPQNIFLDSFDVELSYQVKELIRVMADRLRIDFRKDETLFYDLVAHMSAAIKRADHLKAQITNPLLGKIIEEYQPMYDALMKAMREIFPGSDFSQDELAYILIHFATALERSPEVHPISILVLCSSGIGTSKILESRLRRYIHSANEIKICRISQMSQLNYREYDLILSTIFLPGFDLPYKMISPLLLDEELQEIRNYINTEIMAVKEKAPPELEAGAAEKLQNDHSGFENLYGTMKVANNLLQRFDVKRVSAEKTLEDSLYNIAASLSGVLISDVEQVTAELICRYRIAPIGIPGTGMALFHSANRWTKDSYFAVYDLDHSFEILGMDKKPMTLERILLMLAPEPMPEEDQNILGKISGSIIESDLNTEIYQKGDKQSIYHLLSSLFVDEIKDIK